MNVKNEPYNTLSNLFIFLFIYLVSVIALAVGIICNDIIILKTILLVSAFVASIIAFKKAFFLWEILKQYKKEKNEK